VGGGRGEVKVVSVGPRGQRIKGWPAATYLYIFYIYNVYGLDLKNTDTTVVDGNQSDVILRCNSEKLRGTYVRNGILK